MKFQVYVPESYTTYEQIEKGAWISTVHETHDSMWKEVETNEKADEWQNHKSFLHQREGVYALRPTGYTVTAENMANICASDELPPHGYMGQIVRLFPGQRLFFAWLGANPLCGLFDLPEELSGNGKSVAALEPGYYAVTPSGLVYDANFYQTAWQVYLEEACQKVQKNPWLFSGAEMHYLLPSGKFGIVQEGLPSGIKFLDTAEVLDWATRTTEDEADHSCWNHVHARRRLSDTAKKFAEEHSTATLDKQYLLDR